DRRGEPRARLSELQRALASPVDAARTVPLRLLPAPLRAALGLPRLRRARDDRAHVRIEGDDLQPLRRLTARRVL
ncbi:MAG: hypothetical protein AVDCRST_MAG53-2930, partial [uncultured Solirubrobacteraceae bacterium]